ncbi:MAG TPA: DUF4230 domain-containing protein [Aggregatilineaceae bacterium]|nr:DUF4230 domain-containing protein [Aggregatilineaceae bacterium]
MTDKRKNDKDGQPSVKQTQEIRERRDPRNSLVYSVRQAIIERTVRVGCLAGLAMAVILGCLLLAILVKDNIGGWLDEPMDNFLSFFGFDRDGKSEEVDIKLIVLEIHKMSLLQTARAEVVVTEKRVYNGTSPDSTLVMESTGDITAGIDVSLITVDNVQADDEGLITVQLPALQVECNIRDTKVESDCTEIPFVQDCDGPIEEMRSAAEFNSLRQMSEKIERREVMTDDGRELLAEGYKNAEVALYNLLNSLGHNRVQFDYDDSTFDISENCKPNE